jgi:predicted N-formylglutamate amidohydrolase
MNSDFPDLVEPTLIGEDDPPAYETMNPEGKAAMLLICDHASWTIPRSMNQLGLQDSALRLHIAWDIGAAAVTRSLSQKLDATAILAGYSRLLIDVNRQPGDLHSIPKISDNTVVPGNTNLSEIDQLERIENFFWPYHHALANALAHLWRRGPAPALFSIHSFTPSLAGEDRYWDIGVLWNRDPRLAVPLLEKLKDVEDGRYYVGDNEPYSGRELAYTTELHAGTRGLPTCAVEIRQDLIKTPEGAKHWANVLATALKDILARDSLYIAEHF